MLVIDRWLYIQKQLIARCDQQTMDIGVEHFSFTRYTPPTEKHDGIHAMVHLSRAMADLGAAKSAHAAVKNTKKECTHANDSFCWQDSWPDGGQWL